MIGEVFRQMTVALAAANLILAMLLIEAGNLMLFVCLGCAVAGWTLTRDHDAWTWP